MSFPISVCWVTLTCRLPSNLGTIADGELPLQPEITPGFGVAGFVLLVSGVAYALFAKRIKFLYCFFSVAFLAAIGVTVLILYLMDLPVSNAIQGAYVVAVIGTGAVAGGASYLFQDVLECLGCFLGGFCFSMWLLTLNSGGLLGSGGAGNIIFICAFSMAGLAFFFSRITREYFMIACSSFSGATATVIGIDCFSRAGLKEFWAWIWALNGNLFPLGADTYPLKRGIRVEQAVTFLIFIVGIISQMRLWRIIQERRARRDAARREREAARQEDDENVGRDVESKNALERRDWEAIYGEPKVASRMSVHTTNDSGLGDEATEKGHRNSESATAVTRQSTIDEVEQIELAELSNDCEIHPGVPPNARTAAELVMAKDQQNGTVTVRVAADETEAVATPDAVAVDEAAEVEQAQPPAKRSAEDLRATTPVPGPQVVPLPFKVPTMENDTKEADESSSIAGNADYNDERAETRSIESGKSSFVRRLSASSANLFRRLSQHSLSRQLEMAAKENSESREELVIPVRGDRDSVAATFDDGSAVDDYDFAESPVRERPVSREIRAELADRSTNEDSEEKGPAQVEQKTSAKGKGKQKAESTIADETETRPGKSVHSETTSGPVSLTKAHLPGGLSKIALSYRTNEWAKHLSQAEAPAPEELNILEPVEPTAREVAERAAPVHVQELQKTAEDATPAPAKPRTVSLIAKAQASMQSSPGMQSVNLTVPSGGAPVMSPASSLTSPNHLTPLPSPVLDARRASSRAVNAIVEEDYLEDPTRSASRQAAVRVAAAALEGHMNTRASPSPPQSTGALTFKPPPPVPGVVSYSSPQTLIGKRDRLLRAKNSALHPDSLRGSPVLQASGSDTSSTHNQGTAAALGRASPPESSQPSSRRTSGTYGPPMNATGDLDDLPLSQRKTIIRERRSSMNSMRSNNQASGAARRSSFGYGMGSVNASHASRRSDLPSQAVRESQLAGFRQSVQRGTSGTPSGIPLAGTAGQSGFGGGYHSNTGTPVGGPLINSVYGIPGTSLGHLLPAHQTQVWDSEVSRDLEVQRQFLMNQKAADSSRREKRREERERGNKRFETRMRTDGELIEAHREAMRRMQSKAT